ncbi:MAG: FeoB-associated Cys-rich membrane protein [Lentimicrobium sp.]|nr:FeoB-associated Cys-rich membrane protein [Lentimicrobium sp.]
MNNYQEILVFVIVGVAVAIATYKLYKQFTNPLKGCSGCASDCSGCQLEELKKEIDRNKKKKAG